MPLMSSTPKYTVLFIIRTSFLIIFLGLLNPIFAQEVNISSSSQTKEKPLWELGLGIGGLSQPYYVGTNQNRTFAFPVPVPVYRGDIFKSDENGVRAQLLKDDRFKLDLSLDFNLAIDSDDVDLREGLDDVDSQLQIGPSLEISLAKSDNSQWLLNLPVRASFGISGDGVKTNGFTFSPNISYFRDFSLHNQDWTFGAAIGPQFGTSEYQNVYYSVEQQFATAERPAFEASGGYAGSRLLLTLRSNNEKRLLVGFLRYENISGASFDDSPLVETNDGLSIGFIYSRYLFKSKKTVKVTN